MINLVEDIEKICNWSAHTAITRIYLVSLQFRGCMRHIFLRFQERGGENDFFVLIFNLWLFTNFCCNTHTALAFSLPYLTSGVLL